MIAPAITKAIEYENAKGIEIQHIEKLKQWGYIVQDERDNRVAWSEDYDVTAINPDTHISKKIDFKVDSTIAQTDNIFFELCMLRPILRYPFYRLERGWFSYSTADYIMFWCPEIETGYTVDVKAAISAIRKSMELFTYKGFANKKDYGSYNFGLLCDIPTLKKLGVVLSEYSL